MGSPTHKIKKYDERFTKSNLTMGQLSLKIMDCMSELRQHGTLIEQLFRNFTKLIDDVNAAHNKLAEKMMALESKLHELEKWSVAKVQTSGDTGDIEQ